MTKFKAGDKVRCVRGDGVRLKEGAIYVIRRIDPGEAVVLCSDPEGTGWWLPDRFELVEEKKAPADQLTRFLYLLLRDHLPSGQVEALVSRMGSAASEPVYSAPHLAEYAATLANAILGTEPRE